MDAALDIGYPQKVLVRLHVFRNYKQYTDVTLKAGDVEIRCHRVILAAASTYFNTMFNSMLKESHEDVIELVGIDPNTLSLLVNYLYWANIKIDIDNVQNLVQASSQFLLTRLMKLCEDFMIQCISTDNAIGFYDFAEQYSLNDLKKAAHLTMLSKFTDVVSCGEFLDMSVGSLIDYISANGLTVVNEDEVFEAVCKWIEKDMETRKDDFCQIIEHVRLPLCTSAFLLHSVATNPLLIPADCHKYLEEALQYKILPTQRRTTSNPRTIPRHVSSEQGCLVVIGGAHNNWNWYKEIKYLRRGGSSWQVLTQLPTGTTDYSAVVVNGRILITGGYECHSDVPSRACNAFDVSKMHWAALPPMSTGRHCHGSVVHNHEVYVIGGYPDAARISVEMFDQDQQRWVDMPDLPDLMRFVHAVSCELYICALGRESPKMFVFNPNFQSWERRRDRPEEVFGLSMSVTTLNNQLFVVGAAPGSCISYNMNFDTWTILTPPMDTNHVVGAATSWQGKIYFAGGVGTDTIDEYNPENDTWSVAALPLDHVLCAHCLVTMDI